MLGMVVTSLLQGGGEELVGGGVVVLLHLGPALARVVHAAAAHKACKHYCSLLSFRTLFYQICGSYAQQAFFSCTL